MRNGNDYTAKDILVWLFIDRKGDWDAIYNDIKSKRKPPFESADALRGYVGRFLWKEGLDGFVTILDEGYPCSMKSVLKPPFVVFYKSLNGAYPLKVGSLGASVAIVGDRFYLGEYLKLKKAVGLYFNLGEDNFPWVFAVDPEHGLSLAMTCIGEKATKMLPYQLADEVAVFSISRHSAEQQRIDYALQMNKDCYFLPHAIQETEDYCNEFISQGGTPIRACELGLGKEN